MTTPASLPKIALIVGANRRESINRKLAQALVRFADSKFATKFVQIDDLPMFNQDLEANLPAEVARFKDDIAGTDGILIVTSEHDRSIAAVLKRCDRLGRAPYGKSAWPNKPAFITGMTDLGMLLLGGEACITFKPGLIDEQGNIGDESTKAFLQGFVDRFSTFAIRLTRHQQHNSEELAVRH